MKMSKRPQNRKKSRGGIPPVEYQFKPGQSGNPGGRPKTKYISEALRRALEAGDADVLAKVLLRLGRKGSITAIKEITDRSEGKAKERVEYTGENGTPILLTVKLVKPGARSE